MNTHASKILQDLLSKRTWSRVAYFMRMKGWDEGREARLPFKRDDVLPLVLSLSRGGPGKLDSRVRCEAD
jgi:hypothetical protein